MLPGPPARLLENVRYDEDFIMLEWEPVEGFGLKTIGYFVTTFVKPSAEDSDKDCKTTTEQPAVAFTLR